MQLRKSVQKVILNNAHVDDGEVVRQTRSKTLID